MSKLYNINQNLFRKQKFFLNISKYYFKCKKQIFNLFINNINYSIEKSIIDVGTTPSLDKDQNVFLEKNKR